MRNLGTPVFSRRYFRMLPRCFATDADVVTVLDGGSADRLGDELLLSRRGAAVLRRRHARRRGSVAGNDFMYWEVMRRAAERGSRLFDFGRSKVGTGAFAFKHNWGFEPAQLHYRLQPGAGGRRSRTTTR